MQGNSGKKRLRQMIISIIAIILVLMMVIPTIISLIG